VPAARDVVLNVACPETFSVPVPRVMVPSLNITEPVGTPPLELTVAVKVTDWPSTDGFSDEAIVALVAARFTVCAKGTEVLAAKLEFPP
jgi:hypothetical protein